MKGDLVIYSIKRKQNKLCVKAKIRHTKGNDNLIINKRINKGIRKNPNKSISNLSDIELTDSEISILNFGLKY